MAHRINVNFTKVQIMTFALRASIISLSITACVAALSASADARKKIDFELSGTVVDFDTKEPIEGAYVVASYKVLRSDFATTASFCVKTKGMYTGKDGKYRFPVEKLDGRSPFTTNAIKSGYFFKDSSYPDSQLWKRQDAEAYSRRDIFLKRQDPSDADWHLSDGEEVCYAASNREAAGAGITFMKLRLAEYKRLKGREDAIQSFEEQIRRLETLPSETASPK